MIKNSEANTILNTRSKTAIYLTIRVQLTPKTKKYTVKSSPKKWKNSTNLTNKKKSTLLTKKKLQQSLQWREPKQKYPLRTNQANPSLRRFLKSRTTRDQLITRKLLEELIIRRGKLGGISPRDKRVSQMRERTNTAIRAGIALKCSLKLIYTIKA